MKSPIKTLFFSSLRVRLVVCSCVSLVLVLACFAVGTLHWLGEWHRAQTNYQKWISGEKKQCERLYCEQAVQIAQSVNPRQPASFAAQHAQDNRTDYEKQLDETLAQEDQYRKSVQQSMTQAVKQNPIDCAKLLDMEQRIGEAPQLGKGYYPKLADWDGSCPAFGVIFNDPGSLTNYISSFGIKPSILFPVVFVYFVGLTVLLLLLTLLPTFFQRMFAGVPLGWKRLILVASLAAGAITAGWYLYNADYYNKSFTADDYLKAFAAGLAALAIVALSLVYGRMVILWVVAGFRDEAKKAR